MSDVIAFVYIAGALIAAYFYYVLIKDSIFTAICFGIAWPFWALSAVYWFIVWYWRNYGTKRN